MHTVAALATHNGQIGLIRAVDGRTIRPPFFQAWRQGMAVIETARSLAEIATQGALGANFRRGHAARRFRENAIRAVAGAGRTQVVPP